MPILKLNFKLVSTFGNFRDINIHRPSLISQDSNGLDHYFVWPNSAIPMQLYLYNYNGSSNITNIFSWRPTETQWWITGFNPEYVNNVNVNTQVMVGCVDFSKYTNANGENEMYDKFKEEMVSIIDKSKYLLWDDINTTVWILWGE